MSFLYTQDFSIYNKLIKDGRLEEVQKSLPYLETQYPKHPFVLYLKASVETDGEKAFKLFTDISENHSETDAGELSNLKVAEYLYSKGLYSQASEQLKAFPTKYPYSDNIEIVYHLLEKSFLATGEIDSVSYYQNIFTKQFPNKNFTDYDYYSSIILNEEVIEEEIIIEEIIEEETPKLGEKPWVIQVGAFGERKNADIIVNRLESAGYEVEVVERTDRVNLYLVQVVRFCIN